MSLMEPEDCAARHAQPATSTSPSPSAPARPATARRRLRARPPARGPDVPRPRRADHPLAGKRARPPRRPGGRGVDRRPRGLRVQPADQPRLRASPGSSPRIAFETDDYTAVQGFVAAGVGVSIIAELGLRDRARRHRRARRSAARRRSARSSPPCSRATARPPRRPCWRCCATSARATPSGARSSSSYLERAAATRVVATPLPGGPSRCPTRWPPRACGGACCRSWRSSPWSLLAALLAPGLGEVRDRLARRATRAGSRSRSRSRRCRASPTS